MASDDITERRRSSNDRFTQPRGPEPSKVCCRDNAIYCIVSAYTAVTGGISVATSELVTAQIRS